MFLIRIAFWLVILILLLPTSEQQQMAVYGTAESAVKDISGFCQRNPGTCQQGASAIDTFTQKAKFGVKMVMNFVKGSKGGDSSIGVASSDSVAGSQYLPSGGGSQNTLTPEDAEPVW